MVWRLLAYDDQILTPMGLVGQPLTERGKRIIKRSYYEGIAGSEKRLCVYFRPSRQTRNGIFQEQVLQVDCHVPADPGLHGVPNPKKSKGTPAQV